MRLNAAPRRGLTLLEVVITMAIIVVVAAMAFPSFDAWFQTQHLLEGVDTLRTDLLRARTRAMEDGQPYRFAWEPSGTSYRIAPDVTDYWPELAGLAGGPLFSSAASAGAGGLVFEEQFQHNLRLIPDGNVDASGLFIVFQPDGSARIFGSDGMEMAFVDLILSNGRRDQRVVRVRAVTGGSSTLPPSQTRN